MSLPLRCVFCSSKTIQVFLPRTIIELEQLGDAEDVGSLLGTETVLLVEDQPAVRSVTREALQRFGYTVLTAGSGLEALQAVSRHDGPIHLLLTDVVLTGMSGRDVARRIRIMRSDVRVLYMSGYTDDVVVHHGVLEKGLAFLEKPFTPRRLVRKVREILDAKESPGV